MKIFKNKKGTRIKIENPQKYIDLYNLEDYLFDIIGPMVKKRGFMHFDEFYKICMWKSARQKNNYLKNKKKIEKTTKNVFLEKNELCKIKELCKLEGIGIPTASAILTIVFPEKYGIIDVRCVEMLKEYGIKKTINYSNWLKYLELIRELAKEYKVTPRDIDKILFAMHKENLEKNNYKNLYE